jgi:large subunit ribosomal protein L21
MFAVIKSGGKQHKAVIGGVLKLEKLAGEAGSEVVLDEVMMIGSEGKATTIGTPLVKGATVTVEVLKQYRDDKIIIFKKQRRQHYRRKNGHRQSVTLVRIKDIRKAS